MNFLSRWLRKQAEEILDRHYEGPDAPLRLREVAIAFAAEHPKATVAEWAEFAAQHAEESYRQGWQRGYEHVEREPEERPAVPPELVADQMDPDWRWSPEVDLSPGAGAAMVPEEPELDHEAAMRHIEEMVRQDGRRRF